MSTLDNALRLAAGGVPVFPCCSSKKPACPHGFQDASADADAVRTLWRDHHGPLIGIPTGTVSGIDVVDIDPRHGGMAWWEENQYALPLTRIHRTRSAGLHILLQHDECVRNSESKIAQGVDTRGEGGYIVWWPAEGYDLVQNNPISPWPLWLLNHYRRAVAPRPVRRAPASFLAPATTNDAERARTIIDRSLERLRAAPEGQRHYRLRAAAYTLGGLLTIADMDEAQAHQRLLAAVEDAGARDLTGAAKTALWGLERGRSEPLQLRRRNHGR